MADIESVRQVKLRRSNKPLLTIDDARVLLQRLFGLRPFEIQEFPSYYDRIYYVKTDPKQGIAEQNEFILKVLNSEFTADGVVETQTNILDFLQSFPELKCQAPLMNKNNHLLSYELIETKLKTVDKVSRLTAVNAVNAVTAVRLFSFLPGKPLLKLAPLPPAFFMKVGKHIGSLQNALQKYPHDVKEDSDNIWCLDKVAHLKNYLWVINDAKKMRIVQDVISEYERKVIPVRGEFRRGVVHQDCNHSNVLAVPSLEMTVQKSQTKDYNVSGIIDFDFTATSFLVYEIAIPMMYLMFCSDEPLEATAYLLAGFESRAPLTEKERGVLRVLIAGRFIQSLVLGLYFASLNPDNSYIGESQIEGWNLLELFLNQSEDDQLKLWKRIRGETFYEQ